MEEELLDGMGAIVGKEGVTYRVWAPHAQKVFVTGSFNDWQEETLPLNAEGNGYWARHVKQSKEGDEYKFVLMNGESKLKKKDPYAKKNNNSDGNSIVYDIYKDWEDHQFKITSFNQLVIYELHVGTFNTEGKQEGEVGDFFTAAKKLDYLKDLGINAIELMPVMEFMGDRSLGYNPAHQFAVETAYGGPDGLKHFIFEAHIRGIAIIMDVVYNHFGPSDMDIWRFDGWHEGDYGGIYFYNDDRAKTPWGENRPDYGRKEVRNFMRDNAMMWLKDYQCDGLRYDATAFIRYLHMDNPLKKIELPEGFRFLQQLNAEIRESFPHKILIAEDLKSDMVVTAPISKNGLGFHSQWGPGFAHGIKRILVEIEDKHRNLQMVVESLFLRFNNDAFQRIIYTESHDDVANGSARLPEEIQPGQADSEYAKLKSTLGAITLLTAPGIPMIFQGQEFVTEGEFSDDQPLDWGKQKIFEGISRLYRDLILLRNGQQQNAIGLTGQSIETLHFNGNSLVLAFSRTHHDHPENPCIVILNYSHQVLLDYQIGLPISGLWQVRFNSGYTGYDGDFSEVNLVEVNTEGAYDDLPFSIKVGLPKFGGIILTKSQ
ncbi:MAG: alpha-amylase family glycosyl hydrolase [Cyclobacteriaceae bacterium]